MTSTPEPKLKDFEPGELTGFQRRTATQFYGMAKWVLETLPECQERVWALLDLKDAREHALTAAERKDIALNDDPDVRAWRRALGRGPVKGDDSFTNELAQ